jgi:hypothetical protein
MSVLGKELAMIKRSEVFEKEKTINPDAGQSSTVTQMEQPVVTSYIGPNAVWGAIFAGIVMVLVAELALALLGGGIGLSAINPDNAKAVGIGAITWWLLSGLIAFYFGGWTAGRLAGIPSRTDGILHGLVTWGATTLLMFLFLTTTIGAMIGGGFALLKSGGKAISQAAPQIAGAVQSAAPQINQAVENAMPQPNGGPLGSLGGDVRQTLEEKGTPGDNINAVQTQLMAEIGVLANQRPEDQEGQKQTIVNTLISNTNMNPTEARAKVDQWSQNGQQAKQDIQQGMQDVKEKAQDVAGKASDVAGKGALASFAMLFLTAIAAGLGGFAGTPWPEERA